MDYDDIEFQSQSFQLVGEDSNKFPSSLQSFALPKIDIDEHLQPHLRFDSLVDTDIFLGIQGQDNNWIEDFSSGTTAIDFSSTAAESCSISRHNNVWSEATSSESVEMLLKSVVDEEMTDRKTSIMDADAHDGLTGKRDQADIILNQEDDHNLKTGDTQENDPALAPNKCLSKVSVVDAIGVQTLVEGSVVQKDSGCTTHTSPQDDPSSAYGNLDVGPGKSNIPLQSNQVVEEGTEISMTERSDLLCDDGLREKSPVMGSDGEVNTQYSEGWEEMSCLSSGKDSSFLDPIMDSVVMMGQGCNESGYSENPDGLLEAIAYPVKALNKGIEVRDRSSSPAKDMSSLMREGDIFIETQTVEVGSGKVPILSQPGENSKDVCYRQPDTGTKVGYSHVELPTQSAKMVDDHGEEQLDSVTEVMGEEHSPECHLTGNSIITDIGDSSEIIVEAHGTVHMDYETQINEVKDDNGLDNFKSQNPASAVAEECFEDEVDEEPEADVNVSDAKSNDPHLPTSLSDVEVKIPSPADSDGKDNLVPSTCPGVTNVNNDDSVLIEEAEGMSSAGQNTGTSVLTDPVAKIMKDESGGGEFVSFKKDPNIQWSHPDLFNTVDGVVEEKGKSLHANLANEPVAIIDTSANSGLTSKGGLTPKGDLQNESGIKVACHDHQSHDISSVEQKEGTNPSPCASEFVDSHDKEIVISSSLLHSEGNLVSQLSSRPVPNSNIDDHAPLDFRMEPQPIVDGQAASYVDIVDGPCKNESQSVIDKPISYECTMGVKGVLAVNDSPSNEKDSSDFPAVFTPTNKEIVDDISVGLASKDTEQTLLEPPSSEKKPSGGDQNCITNASALTLSRSDAEAHLVEADSVRPSSMEPNCDSPTVISCSEHHEDHEGSRILSGQTGTVSSTAPPVSTDTGGNSNKVQSSAKELKESAVPEEDKSFTFEVSSLADLSEKGPGSEWKPFSSMQSSGPAKISKGKSRGSHTEFKEGKQHGVRRKTPNVDNSSRVTVSSNESLTTPKGKSVKKTPRIRATVDRDARSCSVSSIVTVSRDMQLEEHLKCIESNKMMTSSSPIVQKSGLPDLNSSVVAASSFYQPFTDPQQVQLRAQIFVYGSLIQGIPPDESCMVSAFGETDGARTSWEGAWRLSLEKHQNKKSPFTNSDTRHSRSAVRMPEQVTRCSSVLSKVSNTSSQNGGKVVPSALPDSSSLPSPVWSISTHNVLNTSTPRGMHLDFSQALSPLHSYYSSQTKQLSSKSLPWPSQVSQNGPQVVPVKGSTLNVATQFSTVPPAEAVQATPVRDSSLPRAPIIQVVPPSALLPTSSPLSVTAASLVKNETQRKTASPVVNKNVSNSPKPRKRKKPAGSEDLGSTIPVTQSTTEPASAAIAKSSPNVTPVSAGLVSPSTMPAKVASGNLLSTTPSTFPDHFQIISNTITEQRAIYSEETSSRIEQAKLQAEDAASLAAASVRHSQGIWSQLAAQRESGLVSEVEVKLASAAVAAAAAASVAKAAAAAAKVASEAALQAKTMADEALGLSKSGKLTQIPDSGFDTGKNLGRLTPDSILKGKINVDGSSSVISAAREAARRRVEAASAATKRAENIDAIVKAAELAAEAVSQAGAIIAMGDPLPFRLNELVDTGPESFWKVHHSSTDKINTNNLGAEDKGLNHSDHHDQAVKQSNKKVFNNKDIQNTATECGVSNNELSVTTTGNYQGGLVNDVTVQNDRHQRDQLSTNRIESEIQQGSFVEVVSNDDGLRGAWFSAHVLDLKDKKAYVCYDLLKDKDSVQLKEWVSLEGEGYTAPRIRSAHPLTTLKHEATRKRRREAVGNYVWAVGDRVDAWMRDGWWEGIVTEKNQGDETKLTIHFPAGGDSSVVRAWNLRPSLIWKDGQWMEWSRAKENTYRPLEGDTPQEKRQRLDMPEVQFNTEFNGRETGKQSKEVLLKDSGKPEESRPLNLSAKDTIFSVGRNVRDESLSDPLKAKRTGLQKQGSRVIFGVPKPGKKRKFMDVSKHYFTDNKTDKTSEGNDSLKFAKYLMPQQSRSWKNTSKVEPKGKQTGESNKPRGVKCAKSQTIQTRSTTEKVNSSISTASGDNGRGGALRKLRAGIGEKGSLEKNPLEVVTFTSNLGMTASQHADSYVKEPGVPAAKNKSAAEGNSEVKARAGSEDKGDSSPKTIIPDSTEPRRSNRRIQPTSRLLEGLQSSLIISKIPSFSHDKAARPRHRGSSSSRGSSRC